MPTTPERIMEINRGAWANAILAAATVHRLFTHVAAGARDAEAIATRAGISRRGAQALVDGLLGLGLLVLSNGKLENAPDAAQFLVEGNPGAMVGLAQNALREMAVWAQLADVVKSGEPVKNAQLDQPELSFWEDLVLAIAPMTQATAEAAAGALAIDAAGPIAILDIGGGSGAFSGTLLSRNPIARATQLDWPNVNRIARGFVEKLGVRERFSTLDGDFHTTDLRGPYDLAIYSQIAHQESPDANRAMFKRVRAALKERGRLVIADFVVPDGREGMPPFVGLFHANMLLRTKQGGVWTEGDYRRWLGEAGFARVDKVATPGPATLFIAQA